MGDFLRLVLPNLITVGVLRVGMRAGWLAALAADRRRAASAGTGDASPGTPSGQPSSGGQTPPEPARRRAPWRKRGNRAR